MFKIFPKTTKRDNNHVLLSYAYEIKEMILEVYNPKHSTITICSCLMYYVLDMDLRKRSLRYITHNLRQ